MKRNFVLFFLGVILCNYTYSQFEIGTFLEVSHLEDEKYRDILVTKFKTATTEEAFKMDKLWLGPNNYKWDEADAIVDFCQQNNIKLRVHSLISHKTVPNWLKNGNYTSEQIKQMLETYIKTVVGRYKNIVSEWDILTEALQSQPSCGLRTDSFWYQKLGADYIKLVFQWADEAASDAFLYYSDSDIEGLSEKSNTLYNLLKQLKQQGVPIDGVGWQCHFLFNWRLNNDCYENLRRLKDLGLQVKVIKLNLRIPLPADAKELELQAKGYADMTYFCLTNKIEMNLWGFTDKYSLVPQIFNGYGAALIFDENYDKKPAYYAIESVLKATVNEGIYNGNFESGPYCWIPHGLCEISTSSEQKFSGSASLFVSSRAICWSGPAQYVSHYLSTMGAGLYQFSVMVYSLIDDEFKITVHIKDDTGRDKLMSIPSVFVPKNQWTTITGTINDLSWYGNLKFAKVYIETINSTCDFYVDDFTMRKFFVGRGSGSGGVGIYNVTVEKCLIDDFDDGDTINTFNESWYTYSNEGSSISPEPFTVTAGGMNPEGFCGYFSWILKEGDTSYAGLATNFDKTPVYFRDYEGISFWYKSTAPHLFIIKVSTTAQQTVNITREVLLPVSTYWVRMEIIIGDLFSYSERQVLLNLGKINLISFQSVSGENNYGEFYLDDVSFIDRENVSYDQTSRLEVITSPEESGYVYVRPNQTRYLIGSTVTLVAIANPDYIFDRWGGEVKSIERKITVVLDKYLKTFIAYFISLSADKTSPILEIISPINNTTVSRNVEILVRAIDNVDVAKVLFYIDNICVSTVTSRSNYTYSYVWNTLLVDNTTHSIKVVACDTFGNSSLASIVVKVNNSNVDEPPSIVSVSGIEEVVSGVVSILINATDDVDIEKVELWLNNQLIVELLEPPYKYDLDTKNYPDGVHNLVVIVYDTTGKTAQKSYELNINNNSTTQQLLLKNRYLLNLSGNDKNNIIDFGNNVEWVKVYDTKGNLVYETKSKLDKTSNLKVGVYIYKAKLKDGKTKVGNVYVLK